MAQEPPKDRSKLKKWRGATGQTQAEVAEKLGVNPKTWAAYESGTRKLPINLVAELRTMGYQGDVGLPTVPAGDLDIKIPTIGYVSASSKVDWTDPFESEDFEYVPGHMADTKGRFSCKILSDSMMPLLQPDDIAIFQGSEVPKIGYVILYRSPDNLITVKVLKHDGANYILHPLNSAYQDELADGVAIGYLVGIVRRIGKRKITDYDPDGIRP